MLVTIAAGPTPALAAPSDEQIREAVDTVLADRRFQSELPNEAEPAEIIDQAEPGWRFELPDGVFGLARLLMWVLIGAGGVLLAVFIINEVTSLRQRLRGRAPQTEGSANAVPGRNGDPGSSTSLDEADRLAGEGRYAEALHMLLLDCIAQLRRMRFDSLIAPSLTSREVASRLSLPEQASGALSAIVSAVELSHFGGRDADAGDYQHCRERYLQIATASAEPA